MQPDQRDTGYLWDMLEPPVPPPAPSSLFPAPKTASLFGRRSSPTRIAAAAYGVRCQRHRFGLPSKERPEAKAASQPPHSINGLPVPKASGASPGLRGPWVSPRIMISCSLPPFLLLALGGAGLVCFVAASAGAGWGPDADG